MTQRRTVGIEGDELAALIEHKRAVRRGEWRDLAGDDAQALLASNL
jgi:hypothetical protein